MKDRLELEMNPVGPWFSSGDEEAFFIWLDKIKCVKRYEGRLRSLYIEVDSALVDERDLREIIALFYRYNIDMKQLILFDRPEFSRWFKNENAYWYDRIFSLKLSGDGGKGED